MKKYILSAAVVAGLAFPIPLAQAAEGAATGNGTSTPAGPAGDGSGPSKSGSMSGSSGSSMSGASKGSMSGGSGMTKSPGMTNQPTATGGQPGGSPSRN